MSGTHALLARGMNVILRAQGTCSRAIVPSLRLTQAVCLVLFLVSSFHTFRFIFSSTSLHRGVSLASGNTYVSCWLNHYMPVEVSNSLPVVSSIYLLGESPSPVLHDTPRAGTSSPPFVIEPSPCHRILIICKKMADRKPPEFRPETGSFSYDMDEFDVDEFVR